MSMKVSKGGEQALRDMFQPSTPVAAGEFTYRLSTDVYAMDVPESSSVPGVVEIVRALLGDDVR